MHQVDLVEVDPVGLVTVCDLKEHQDNVHCSSARFISRDGAEGSGE
jgi:hypothetical protein